MPILIDNPIAWAHFRLRGGWKNVIGTMTGYTVIISGLILFSLRTDSYVNTNTLHYWTQALLAIQLGTAVIFIPSAIRNSIRKDITTRMIESHRLMPVPATQAIPGFIVGSIVQFGCMMAITFLIGMSTSLGASIPPRHWLLANGIVAIFGFCLWFAAVLFSFLSTANFGILGIVVIVSLLSRGLILLILPGLGVLTGPMIGKNVFGIIEGGGTWDWEYQVSATAQLCAAGLCFLAAVRKYRRDDQVAFTPLLGMVLLGGWVLLCVLGIKYWNVFETRMFGRMPPELEIRVVGSIVSSLLLALVPVSSAAWLEREWERRHRLADVSLQKRAVPPHVVVLLAVLIILALPVVGQNLDRINTGSAHLLETSLSAAFFLLSSLYLLRILYRVTTRVLIPMLALIVVTWAFPYLIDIARYAAVGDPNTEILTWISTCSPIGMLAAIWNDRDVVLWPGLIVQSLPFVLLALLFHNSRRKPQAQTSGSVGQNTLN